MRLAPDLPAERLDRSGYELVVDEHFAGPTLDTARWLPHYLPQWSTPDRSAARYALGPEGLTLRIDHDQPAWSPEYDGELRVSNLQTGGRSGPVGSGSGQHPFREALVVRTAQPERRLWLPHHGLIEVRLRASPHPRALTALWLIGFEHEPEQSGELCLVEIFGRDIHPDGSARVGLGIHPFGDPALRDDFVQVPLAGDALDWHTYSVEWMPGSARFFIDDVLVAEADQSPAYPLQLMLNLYELPDGRPRDPAEYPLEAGVQWVRESRLR
ncbi:glycoside hydrolase family 16 protein [Microcella humidisoli]|uniref:Glycoside hydrolase family 16 protein n=1 Tax=Microcella humidisoli TaxID=2963406 RepID=A0ABY5FUW7_9MICO|nr:glycoside hydrolase family 16 protein [Microcella humidisoli]UTT61912.1 glycoside hydrolase family 16 protein [Microcella humidisoli]